jgi:hypothetical protein
MLHFILPVVFFSSRSHHSFLGHAGGMRWGQPARNGEHRVGTGHSGGHGGGSGEKGKGK